jgi:UDP-glucose 4-epimerase
MRVLVTGGAGYIGSGVVEELIAAGHRAVVYDSLYKGHRDAVHPEAGFVQADLLDVAALRSALRGADAVVHMAADSSVGESVQHPAKYYRNNLVAGLSLLGAMQDEHVRWLVFSSSAAVYGESAKQPIEETDPTKPTNPYGETKLAFENALRWYSGAHGLRPMSLRYFNAAGATPRCRERHEPETHLVPLVLQAALGRIPEVTIFGDDYPTPDGTCIRDYIHVGDIARAHVLAVEALSRGHAGGAYNLGCGGGYSVKQVIDVARSVCGRSIPVRIGPRRSGDPAVLVASSERISRELGWKPRLQDLRAVVESAWDAVRSQSPVIL